MSQVVGTISQEVISLLDLPIQAGTLIHLGDSNIRHMKNRHPQDFQKYGANITDIFAYPDYVAKNPKDDSIEYGEGISSRRRVCQGCSACVYEWNFLCSFVVCAQFWSCTQIY